MASVQGLPQLFEYYAGRSIKRVYLNAEAATALAVSPDPVNNRIYVDIASANVESIYVQSGWIVVQAGSAARQRVYLNPEHVVGIVWDTDQDLPDA